MPHQDQFLRGNLPRPRSILVPMSGSYDPEEEFDRYPSGPLSVSDSTPYMGLSVLLPSQRQEVRSEPVPGWDLHSLKNSAFSRRTARMLYKRRFRFWWTFSIPR